MYTGELDLTKQSGEDILGLLIATDELLLEELFKYVQDYLIEKQTSWVRQNFVLVLHVIFKFPSCKELQDYCLESICAEPKPFITSKYFPSLDKDILFGLIKRDDLQVEEIDIWDCLINWGIEQTPGLGSGNSDRAKWNQEDFEALKEMLNPFIPLIRFVEISRVDFFDKVRPYKAVIPHQIYEEVDEFHYKGTLPKTTNLSPRLASKIINPASTIIKSKLATIIANWIDRNDSTVQSINNKYIFNLIYLKSRDGFDYKTFHNKCNLQGPFVILIKVQSKKIYGGYNPIGFASRKTQWVSSSDSFIFSFENDQDIHNMKIGRVINTTRSVWENYNLTFFNFGGHLYINGQNLHLHLGNPGNYNNIFDNIGGCDFPIEEIEVYQVKKIMF